MMTIFTFEKICGIWFCSHGSRSMCRAKLHNRFGSSSSASARFGIGQISGRKCWRSRFLRTDRSVLDASSRGTLVPGRMAEPNGGINLTIEGHADERGTREYNLALVRVCQCRARFLISQGVNGNRLQTISFGKERPVSLCSEESCWSKNRRSVSTIR